MDTAGAPQQADTATVALTSATTSSAPHSSAPGSATSHPEHDEQNEQGTNATLKLEKILLKQFEFASQTAQAVRQDSSQMIYFYWVMFGVLVAGLGFLLQLGGGTLTAAQAQGQTPGVAQGLAPYAQPLMLLALLGAGTVHLAFYSRWVRLRRRYTDCFAFMTGISTFYVQRFERAIPEIATLLAWQPESTGVTAPLGTYLFTVYALLPTLGSLFFAAAALVAGEIWLRLNGGALFPPPTSLPLYGVAGVVFVLALGVFVASGRPLRATEKPHIPVLGDI